MKYLRQNEPENDSTWFARQRFLFDHPTLSRCKKPLVFAHAKSKRTPTDNAKGAPSVRMPLSCSFFYPVRKPQHLCRGWWKEKLSAPYQGRGQSPALSNGVYCPQQPNAEEATLDLFMELF